MNSGSTGLNQCALSAKITANPPRTGTATNLTTITPQSTLLGTLAFPGPLYRTAPRMKDMTGTVAPEMVCRECATNSSGAWAPKSRFFKGGQQPTPMPASEIIAGQHLLDEGQNQEERAEEEPEEGAQGLGEVPGCRKGGLERGGRRRVEARRRGNAVVVFCAIASASTNPLSASASSSEPADRADRHVPSRRGGERKRPPARHRERPSPLVELVTVLERSGFPSLAAATALFAAVDRALAADRALPVVSVPWLVRLRRGDRRKPPPKQ